jgi:hypothetical protein
MDAVPVPEPVTLDVTAQDVALAAPVWRGESLGFDWGAGAMEQVGDDCDLDMSMDVDTTMGLAATDDMPMFAW